ncbi:MAG: hypothetical protein ACNS63_09740 [Candidatus Nitrospinota bacterium M3_3B_026]
MSIPRPSEAVEKLEKMLGSPAGSGGEDKEKALDELVDLLEKDTGISRIMKDNEAGVDALKEIFHTLETNGAGVWVGGRYVPAASLFTPEVLSYFVTVRERDELNSLAINQVLGYFDGLTARLVPPGELLGR